MYIVKCACRLTPLYIESGSAYLKGCGTRGRTRTGTALRPRDFKSLMSTIPPRGHGTIPMRPVTGGQDAIRALCRLVW